MVWQLAIWTYGLMVQVAVGGFLVLAATMVAVMLTGEPARRGRVMQCGLAALVILPLLVLVPGYPRWAILPAAVAILNEQAPNASLGEARLRGRVSGPWKSLPQTPVNEAPILSEEKSTTPTDEHNGRVEPVPADPAPLDEATRDRVEPPATTYSPAPPPPMVTSSLRPPTDFRLWAVALYLAGMTVMALWSLVGLAAVKRLLAASRPADDRCREMLRQLAGTASDRVALVVSARARQPCAVAWRPTTIVLPETLCATQNEQRLRWALAHEWSHVEHGDVWTWSLASALRLFYFYQPLLWLLRRHLQLCQDYVADAQAARAGGNAEDYAEFLTSSWITGTHPPLAAGLGIGGRASDLTRRVVMLVERSAIEKQPLETASPTRWNLAAITIAVLLLAAVGTIAAHEESPKANKTKTAAPALVLDYVPLPVNVLPEQAAASEPDRGPKAVPYTIEPIPNSGPRVDAVPRGIVVPKTYLLPQAAAEPSVEPTPESPKPAAVPEPAARPEAKSRAAPRWSLPAAETHRRTDPSQPFTLQPGDIVNLAVEPEDNALLRSKPLVVEHGGTLPLGPRLGRVAVAGKTLEEAEATIVKVLEQELREPQVQLTYAGRSADGTTNPESPSLESLRREIEELRQAIRDLRAGKLPPQLVPTR